MIRDAFNPLVYEAGYRFRYWSEAAEPVIRHLLREFPQQLDGLQYRADQYFNDESGSRLVTLSTNADNAYSRKYFDDVYNQETIGFGGDISSEIIFHLKFPYDLATFPRVDNPRRNKLLAELRNRTGVDVKKEISLRVRKVREADEKRILNERREREENMFGKPSQKKGIFSRLFGL